MKTNVGVWFLLLCAILAGCGGAESGGEGCTPTLANPALCVGGGTAAPGSLSSAIDVIASSVEVGSGGDTVTVSAIVKDAGNVGLPGVGIVFNTNNGILTQPTVTTNASGVATVTYADGAD